MRPPTVAGIFYPAEKGELQSLLDLLFSQAKPSYIENAKGIIVPHAGYIYSGHVAASGYKSFTPKSEKFVILGVDHRNHGIIATSNQDWQTPLGIAKIDKPFVEEITKEHAVEIAEEVIKTEHSIEVQLPFLQYLFNDKFVFTPIQLPHLSFNILEELAEILARKDRFYIASSDFTHYGFTYNYVPKDSWDNPLEFVKELDKRIINLILELNPKKFYDSVLENGYTVCGHITITLLLLILKRLGAKKGKLISYDTSFSTSKDLSAIVGYASIVFF